MTPQRFDGGRTKGTTVRLIVGAIKAGIGVATLAAIAAVGPVRAQERGIVQVSARVVEAAPSREALAEIGSPISEREEGRLYRMTAVTVTDARREEGEAEEPRRVVTIEFLGN